MMIIGSMAVLGCSGVSKEQYSAKDKEAKQATEQVSALQAKVKTLEQQNAELASKNGTQEAQADKATQQMAALQAKVETLQQQNTALLSKIATPHAVPAPHAGGTASGGGTQ
jgi:peptidoglycan hydrolase CwlO-like protein